MTVQQEAESANDIPAEQTDTSKRIGIGKGIITIDDEAFNAMDVEIEKMFEKGTS